MIITRQPTASAALVLDLFDGLAAQKLINNDDLRRLNLQRDHLMDVEKRVPVTLIHELWQCALSKNPPSNLGLTIGRNLHPSAKGILAHLVSQSDNLEDALKLFRDKSALMSEGERIEYQIADGHIRIQYQFSNPLHGHKFAVERSLSIALTWCRHLTGHKCIPIECGFQHGQVEHLDQYQEMFGTNIKFSQKQDYLLFPADLLQLPLKNTNPYLKALLLKQAQDIEEEMAAPHLLSNIVIELIKENLSKGNISVCFVAAQLNMSRQTLHRKLKQENNNFTQLLTNVRKQLALHYLKQDNCPIDTLSEQLGFEEPSAFFKAFKAWFKTTPKAYRQLLLAQISPS